MKFQRTLSVSAFCALLAAMSLAVAQTGRVDPLDSARWGDMHHSVLADAPFEFDDRVRVIAPTTAENPMQVPVTVDATALPVVHKEFPALSVSLSGFQAEGFVLEILSNGKAVPESILDQVFIHVEVSHFTA